MEGSAAGPLRRLTHGCSVTITGSIASGKNTVAATFADLAGRVGMTVVVADVDDVAATVAAPGAAATGLWFAAHDAHGAMVARWLASDVDVVVAVGPFHTEHERGMLLGRLPADVRPLQVLLDAPLDVTWQRAVADESRGVSRQRDFHETAHARFRSLLPGIPFDLAFDTSDTGAAKIAAAILAALPPRH